MTTRIQLALFWDDIQWSVEADDLDADGNYDSSWYAIENGDSRLFNHLDRRCTYEAWAERVGSKTVRIVEIGELLATEVDCE